MWVSVFDDQFNQPALDLLQELRERKIKVAFCSNTNTDHWEEMRKRHPVFRDLTDPNLPDSMRCHLSYKLGKMKTDPLFFDSVVGKDAEFAEHHLLLDDLPNNCRAAEAAGLYAIELDPADPQPALAEVRNFLGVRFFGEQPL
jgi:FMN phosphatase YigB (HAD superfamily)